MAKKPHNTPAASMKTKAAAGTKKAPQQGFFRRNIFPLSLFLICFVVFFNSIGNEYALDDEFYTNGSNKLTQKGFKGIPEIFKSRTFYNNDGSGYSYRPVAVASFAVEIQLFGEHPHVSHFVNLLLYALTIVVLFALLRRWFAAQGNWFSFFICLLFLAHPLHTEVVDNIKCRDELLTMLFTLLSMLCIWRHLETKKWVYFVLFFVCFLAGVLSKQTILPFLILIPLSLWFFTDIKWTRILLYFWPLIVAMLISTLIQRTTLPHQARTFLDFENPLANHVGFMKHSATSAYVLGRYLFLHFIPFPLVYYYGSNYVPVVTWSNPIAILSLLAHIGLAYWAFKELRKKSAIGFGLLFYLGNMAAYSNFFQPAPGLMAERFAYASSLGFCIVLVVLIFRWTKTDPALFKWKVADYKRTRFIFIGLALLMTIRCWWRNEDWEDKMTLYSADMETLHESVKANMLYAALLAKNGLDANLQSRQQGPDGRTVQNPEMVKESERLFKEARTYYAQAANLAPYYYTAWSNLGTTYFFTGETKEALPYFLKSVRIKKNYQEGWYNVGMAYDKLGMTDSAEYSFRQSIRSDSGYVQSYEQLVRILMRRNHDPEESLNLLHAAVRHKPDSDVPWNDIGAIYLQMKDTARSAQAYEMAAKNNPDNLQRLDNLARYYYAHGDMEKYNLYTNMIEEGKRRQEKVRRRQQK